MTGPPYRPLDAQVIPRFAGIRTFMRAPHVVDLAGVDAIVYGIPFDTAMLSWPAGPKHFDGVWAPHWYNAVWASTGFGAPPDEPPPLPPEPQKIADEARPYYEKLKAFKL